VAAVIAVVSLVQGLQFQISKQLENVGATFIRVVPDFARVQRNPFLTVPTLSESLAGRAGFLDLWPLSLSERTGG